LNESDIEIRLATPTEAAECPEIERRAAQMFSVEYVSPEPASKTFSLSEFSAAQREDRLIVALDHEGEVRGFAYMIILGERVDSHLEELDVDPEWGRRGIGARLVRAACGWSQSRGYAGLTLTTFRDVPWNAPFYARMGFEVLEEASWTEAIQKLREDEREDGLDPEKRVVMRRTLMETDSQCAPHQARSIVLRRPVCEPMG
jgi:GNAT superfamily N-acetyltransferase